MKKAAYTFYRFNLSYGGAGKQFADVTKKENCKRFTLYFHNQIRKFGALFNRLEGLSVRCQDFREFLDFNWNKESFLYFDPPYIIGKDRNYDNEFKIEDHKDLANELVRLSKICPMLLSIDDSSSAHEIYGDRDNFIVQKVSAHTGINAGNRESMERRELLIRNYKLVYEDYVESDDVSFTLASFVVGAHRQMSLEEFI
jgi:site-specific DNA-adenine methylase